MNDVTRILSEVEQGDDSAAERLLPLVYDELRKLAAAKLAREKPGQTLQATALVHEAYLRLLGNSGSATFDGRGHFFAAAGEAMRRLLTSGAYQIGIAADDRTLLVWDHDQLVAWQLVTESQRIARFATAMPVQQFQQVGTELITVSNRPAPAYLGTGAVAPAFPIEMLADEPQRLVGRMQAIFERSSSALYWRQTAMGMAHLRNGSARDAIEWLQKPLDPDSSVIPTCEVRALAALAIAYHQEGDQAKANETYQRATGRFAEEAPAAETDDLGPSWHDWLICELLLQEAKTLLAAAVE